MDGWRTDPKRLTCNKRVAFGLTRRKTDSELLFLAALIIANGPINFCSDDWSILL
jgi:hypothetical protein